jgi:hypothetical protein
MEAIATTSLKRNRRSHRATIAIMTSSRVSLLLQLILSLACCWSTTNVLVYGATRTSSLLTSPSLNPLSIGIRSAIVARRQQLPQRGGGGKFEQQQHHHHSAVGASSSSSSNLHRHQRPWWRIGRQSNSVVREKSSLIENNEEHKQLFLTDKVQRGGAGAILSSSSSSIIPAVAAAPSRRLHFWEAMICGAVSRAAAQTIMHPANTMKTMLQSSRKVPGQKAPLTVLSFLTQWEYTKQLTRGAGAQLVLSIPHGAVNFAVLELVRRRMNGLVSLSKHADSIHRNFGPGMDFISSAISTICCSVVSTPQMMICDNIMAGTYPNLVSATRNLMKDKGVAGFYTGWWPGLAGKIPSYVSVVSFYINSIITQSIYLSTVLTTPLLPFANRIIIIIII